VKRSVIPFFLFAIVTASSVSCPAQNHAVEATPLYQGFLDPPHDFSLMPFWFWNGKMQGPIIQQEIRDMVDQHVYGAFLHARDGLQTPYLSEEWWNAIGAGLKQSRTSGFEFNFVDEYDWPSGEVRNVWMAGNHQSEVLAKRPDLRMKTLEYESKVVAGPQIVDIAVNADSQAIVASRWLGKDQIDATTLTLLDSAGKGEHIQWSAPPGQWVITQFSLKPAIGFDGGFVDLMNPDTTNLFFNLVYSEYHRRFPSYIGNTIRYAFSDHEGDYGYRIAWTPQLFAAFQQRTGYDLRKTLPLLIYNGGDLTTKVRTDYLSTVTELYGSSFWQGITKSAEEIGLHRTGHAWEESLQWAAALEGSLFTVERGLNPVGVDSLFDWGRQPLNFKVAQSVADFEGRRLACENQGVQGTDSYLDLEAIRKGTNGIGASGVNLFIPHAINYDPSRANYPPDWLHQPYWSYFHLYADYTRRISYMNADSRHVTNVLLYYPITTIWADTRPLFSGETDYQQIGLPAAWKNQTILINDYYTRILLELSNHHWDYNIADDQYMESARVDGNELVIGPQRFRAIILPPITTLSRTTLKKLEQFHQAGGIILGIRLLPTASPEAGGNDAVIKAGIASIFGPGADGVQTSSAEQIGSKTAGSFYINDSVDAMIDTLDAEVPKDVQVVSGPDQHLFFEHRGKLDADYYWVVNDTDRKRVNEIHFAAKGIPEKWNALTGAQEPLFYVNGPSGTEVRLNLDPWDAFYVVFRPLTGPPQDAVLEATNAERLDGVSRHGSTMNVHVSGAASASETYVELRSGTQLYRGAVSSDGAQALALSGHWQFRPKPDRVSVPYAKVSDASEATGVRLGWAASSFDDQDWPQTWLNEQQNTVRRWKMIGPFPNTDNDGFAKIYPPEQEFDLQKRYEGLDGQVGWEDYNGNEPYLVPGQWNLSMKTGGGSSSDSGYVVNFNPELLTDAKSWIVSYAHTYLYSPSDQHAQFIVAADNWAGIWLNQKQVFAQLRTPFWYELNDSWADRVSVDLHKGWNEVLVKVGKSRGTPSGFYGFSFRVADDNGNTLSNVVASASPNDKSESATASNVMHYYRIEVPPGCVAIVPPVLRDSYRMLLNGQELPVKGDVSIDLQARLHGEKNILVIIARKDDPLVSPVQFVTGNTPFLLKPWTETGLANFSGTAVYTKTFTIPETYRGKRVMLDLGRVSSVADVFVNGEHAGTLVWRPYQLDISRLIKPGENEIKILVTNTEANQRAVGTWHHILAAIDICGMEGPVQLIPYIDRVLTLQPVQDNSKPQTTRGK
jgi:alpha-L-rhamnosidase/Glycosyl hydrolase 2 galactose-binding domain-like